VLKRVLFIGLCVSLSLLVLSCGGSKSSSAGGGGGGQGGGVQFVTPTSGPTIELGQSVNLTVSAPSGATVTWTLQNGNGTGKPAGTLTPSGSSATYTAPAIVIPPPACSSGAAPPPIQMNVTASDATGDSASLTIVILTALPCVQSSPQVLACSATSAATTCNTYPSSVTANPTCPANGTLLPPGQSGVQPFVVGSYNSIPIYEGGTLANQPYGEGPYTWTVSSGSLPSGLSLTPGSTTASIFIAGTPVSAGCSTFTLQITDALGGTGTGQFFVVVVPPPLKVQSPNTATAYGGASYLTTLTAIGGTPPYGWAPSFNANSVNPNSPEDLPPALTLTFPQKSSTNSTAVISGTISPQDVANTSNGGAYSLYLQVHDSQSPYPALGSPSVSTIQVLAENSLCLPASAINPGEGYGGVSTGGSVPVDAFLQGHYAFVLRGFDATGPVAIAGSVQTDGAGKVIAGEEDVTRGGGSQTVSIISSGSSYTMGFERNRGCMTLQDSSGTTSTYAFTVGSCSNSYTKPDGTIGPDASACGIAASGSVNVPAALYTSGRMIEFDSNGTHVSGILRLQDSSTFTSGLSGLYAFGLSGWDSASKHYAAAGSMQAASGTLSAVAADINDGGTIASTLTGGSGTVATPDANGRAAATLTVGTASFNLALYAVSSSEALLATTDLLSATQPIASGEAIGTTATFGPAALQNTHILHMAGLSGTSPDVNIGVVTFDGISSFTGTSFENQAGTLGKIAVSGTYSVDATTGRTFFTSATSQDFTHPFVAYILPPPASLTRANCVVLSSCVTGFLVGADSTSQDGILEFQTSLTAPPPPFNNKYILGDYTFGLDEALDSLTADQEGYETAAATASTNAGTLNGNQDLSYSDATYCLLSSCTLLLPEGSFAGTYIINTDGTGSFGGFNGETVSVTNGRVTFYLDESPLNLHPAVVVGEQ
jgi:Putative Ig domain